MILIEKAGNTESLFAVGMLPFWIYTLGTQIPTDDTVGEVKIPFVSMVTSLSLIIGPLIVGYIIQKKLPRLSLIIKKCLRVSLCFLPGKNLPGSAFSLCRADLSESVKN